MNVTIASVKSAICSYYVQQVAASWPGQWKTQFENLPLVDANGAKIDPPTDVPWVKLNITFGEAITAQVGGVNANTHRFVGSVIYQMMGPVEEGTGQIDAIVDKILGIMVNKIIMAGSIPVKFQTPAPRVVGRVNNWFQVNLVCPFFFDGIG